MLMYIFSSLFNGAWASWKSDLHKIQWHTVRLLFGKLFSFNRKKVCFFSAVVRFIEFRSNPYTTHNSNEIVVVYHLFSMHRWMFCVNETDWKLLEHKCHNLKTKFTVCAFEKKFVDAFNLDISQLIFYLI